MLSHCSKHQQWNEGSNFALRKMKLYCSEIAEGLQGTSEIHETNRETAAEWRQVSLRYTMDSIVAICCRLSRSVKQSNTDS